MDEACGSKCFQEVVWMEMLEKIGEALKMVLSAFQFEKTWY
jgi:hypothetical protein